jgi:hypothetical protein
LINCCPIEKQEVFWKEKVMAEAHKALNKTRRQNTNNAMKNLFLGTKDGSGTSIMSTAT